MDNEPGMRFAPSGLRLLAALACVSFPHIAEARITEYPATLLYGGGLVAPPGVYFPNSFYESPEEAFAMALATRDQYDPTRLVSNLHVCPLANPRGQTIVNGKPTQWCARYEDTNNGQVIEDLGILNTTFTCDGG